MDALFSNTNLTVNQLIEQVDTGALGLPELQRGYIWKDSQVRNLFDSMMKGYPIGYLMLWECPAFEKKKSIGTDDKNYDEPKSVIIDGQQRLTSLYAVIKGKTVADSKFENRKIIISYHPTKNIFEVGCNATKKDKEWIYNITDVYTSDSFTFINAFINQLRESRKSKNLELKDEDIKIVSENIINLSSLKKYLLPVFEIKANTEEEDVSDIFVRVNSGGVALKQNDFILTLVSLYWDEGRKMLEKFAKESTEPSRDKTVTSYNQITGVSAQDIIRVVIAYAFDRARLKYGYKLLRGADFDKKGTVDIELRNKRFDILKNKLPEVLDVHSWHEFLKCIQNAGYLSGDLILSRVAIFYSYSFYLIAKKRFNASYNENLHLTSLWFFYAQLVSLYSGSFESVMENHLNSIKEFNNLTEYKNFIISKVNEKLTDDYFNITLVGSEGLAVSGKGNNAWNAYVASLIILDSHILFSKTNLLLSKMYEPGTDGNRKSLEKHHLFPKAYLQSLGFPDGKINQMANYAFIDWKDNMEILDSDPSLYYKVVCEGRTIEEITNMENENALPHGWENMKYEEFLEARRKLMASKIKKAFEKLKNNV